MERLIMLQGYVRRQRFLARLQAVEVARVLLGEKGSGQVTEISTAEMFDLIR